MFWDTQAEKQARQMAQQGAAGVGPSAARAQLAQGLAQSQNAMAAQAAGVRQNPLAAMRMAQQQAAAMAGQANMQSAQLRGQEQLQGQQQLQQIAAQDAATQQALVGGLVGMGSTALSGGIAGMAAKPAAEAVTSDIRAKHAIQPGAGRTDELLRAIGGREATFRYNDPQRNGGGERLGVMAQDVQRAAPELVQPGPDGQLQIDGPGALSASLAANARLAERLDALEQHVGRPRAAAPAPAPYENKGKFDEGRGPEDNPDYTANIGAADRANPVPPPPPASPYGVPVPAEILAARRQAADQELQQMLAAGRTGVRR